MTPIDQPSLFPLSRRTQLFLTHNTMDWNSSFVSQPLPNNNSFQFLYSYSFGHQLPGMEMKHPEMGAEEKGGRGGEEKKKRMTKEQLEALERSFQEEVKLEPERKMRLSRDLGLQPRQIAVWFQNRRARWKAKQLERLYDALKREFHVVSMEKQKLQDEVIKLKTILRDLASGKKQVTSAYTEISGEETVENSSIRCSLDDEPRGRAGHHQLLKSNHLYGAINTNSPASSPYWPTMLPSYP